MLFIIEQTWKQPRCPSTEEWIKKMWYIYIMVYYSAEKNNNIMKFAGKWKELENIILSEVTQTQKDKHASSLPSPLSFYYLSLLTCAYLHRMTHCQQLSGTEGDRMDGLDTVPIARPGSDPGANSTASFLSEQAEKHLRDRCELDLWASGGLSSCGLGETQENFQLQLEDEKLWIASRLIWFDQPRPPDSSQTAPVKIGPSS
ncbi:hypothetical protein STEG23_031436 [Scotinomys teguina]